MARRQIHVDNPHRWVTQHVAPKSLALDTNSADGTHRPEELAHASSTSVVCEKCFHTVYGLPRKTSPRHAIEATRVLLLRGQSLCHSLSLLARVLGTVSTYG